MNELPFPQCVVPKGAFERLKADLFNPSPVCREALTKTLNDGVASEEAFGQLPINRRYGRTKKIKPQQVRKKHHV